MRYKVITLGMCLSFLVTCTEPVAPEFDFKSGLVSVEGFVSTAPGGSFVRINEINEFNIGINGFVNVFISGAQVSFINTNTGNMVLLDEDEEGEIYSPPSDFIAAVGETWELDITLADGRSYKSLPETINESIPIKEISATYNPELVYRVELEDFAPGHSIEVDFDDPSEGENFYYWSFRSFEFLEICVTCHVAHIYRDDMCIPLDPLPPIPDHVPIHTYYCENDCWQIRYNQNINIYSDKFSNGSTIEGLPIANILLYTKRDILIEIQQFSLSAAAYEYYETLKDIVEDNGGFNSPPSAALVGNMFSPSDSDEFVLGRFTAASADVARIFLERWDLTEEQIEIVRKAPEGTWPIQGFPPEEWVFYAPCQEESRYNTSVRPEGWPPN